MSDETEGLRSAEQRLGRLERQNRQIMATVVVLAVAMAGSCITSRMPAKSKILQVEKLVIVDKDGGERATLSTTSEGASDLVLKDANGEPRLRVAVLRRGGPRLVLLDNRDRARSELSLSTEGSPEVSLRGDDGEIHLWLALDRLGNGALLLRDGEGSLRAMLGPTSFKTASMKELQNETVVLLDKTGKVSWATH
jgi:hypothetical protein